MTYIRNKYYLIMEQLTNPAVTSGVDLFVNIVVILVAFGAAISLVDFRKTQKKKRRLIKCLSH